MRIPKAGMIALITVAALLSAGMPCLGDNPPPAPSWCTGSWLRTGCTLSLGVPALDVARQAKTQIYSTDIPVTLWDSFYRGTDGIDPSKVQAEFQTFLQQVHDRQMKFVAYLVPIRSAAVRSHPEWVARAPDGSPVGGKTPIGCLLSGYGDYVVETLANIAQRFPVDGFWLDGYTLQFLCHCETCQKRFHAASGYDVPQSIAWQSPAFRAYVAWWQKALGDHARRLMTRLRRVRSDMAVFYNAGWARPFGGNYSSFFVPAGDERFWLIPSVEHGYFADNQADGIAYTFKCRQVAGIASSNLAEIVLPGNPHGMEEMPTPMPQLLSWALGAMTEGVPTLWAVQNTAVAPEQLSSLFSAINARTPYVSQAEPLSYAAMLVSGRTDVFYGRMASPQRPDVEAANRRYMWGLWGSFRALSEAHLPVDIISEEDLTLERLRRYKALLLDNAACLSAKEMDAIRAYVRGGGGLVATYESSLYTPDGERQSDFALSDLLGIHYQKELALKGGLTGQENRGLLFLQDHAITRDTNIQKYMNRPAFQAAGQPKSDSYGSLAIAGGALQVEPLSESTVIGTIGKEDASPALIVRNVGKGRVAYIASNIGQSYLYYSYPHLRSLLANALQWAAKEEPAVRVQGPLILRTTCFSQENGKRWVVHLLNDMSSLGRISPGLHSTETVSVMPVREEVIPLRDIVVRFRDTRIRRVHLEPEGMNLPLKREGDWITVTVPILQLHSMVVAERSGEERKRNR